MHLGRLNPPADGTLLMLVLFAEGKKDNKPAMTEVSLMPNDMDTGG